MRFLLDENIKKELLQFLNSEGLDAVWKPKGLSNGRLAEFSKSEKRILITNDKDFIHSEHFPSEKVFSVIRLKVRQSRPDRLIASFKNLLNSDIEFEGNLITLFEDKFVIDSIS
jgi:predicted nuclease of predicted toxin-antitoxin system|tara:strand:+ start:812 stop:1153 length:342 start_codon:yes stop_codon:yes gene_type:complete